MKEMVKLKPTFKSHSNIHSFHILLDEHMQLDELNESLGKLALTLCSFHFRGTVAIVYHVN